MNKYIASSIDPQKLSLTIKGVIGLVATIVAFFGIVLPIGELNPIADQIGDLVALVAGVVSLGFTIYGGIRKIYNTYFKK